MTSVHAQPVGPVEPVEPNATQRAKAAHAPRGWVRRFGGLPAALVLALGFGLPLASLVVAAFEGHGEAFAAIALDPLVRDAFVNSLALAVGAGTASLIVGALIAVTLARQAPRRRRIWLAAMGVPLAFSGLVIAYGFILAFGRSGFVTLTLASLGADPVRVGALIYTAPGLIAAYAYYLIPRVALMVYPAIANLDRRPIDAALTLGATPLRAIVDVALRELRPTLAAAWCLVTAIAMGTYGTALALAGTQINILPLLMFLKMSDGQTDFPQAAALSLVLMAVCSGVLALGECLVRRHPQ
jgi:putative spermidine/putrescine transport system permease protein